MLNRVLLVVLCAGIAASAQMKLSVEQLKQFIQSSVAMKQDDRKVAQYLKKVQLTSQLDAATVEDLQGLGAGPRTMEALKALMTATAATKLRVNIPFRDDSSGPFVFSPRLHQPVT